MSMFFPSAWSCKQWCGNDVWHGEFRRHFVIHIGNIGFSLTKQKIKEARRRIGGSAFAFGFPPLSTKTPPPPPPPLLPWNLAPPVPSPPFPEAFPPSLVLHCIALYYIVLYIQVHHPQRVEEVRLHWRALGYAPAHLQRSLGRHSYLSAGSA